MSANRVGADRPHVLRHLNTVDVRETRRDDATARWAGLLLRPPPGMSAKRVGADRPHLPWQLCVAGRLEARPRRGGGAPGAGPLLRFAWGMSPIVLADGPRRPLRGRSRIPPWRSIAWPWRTIASAAGRGTPRDLADTPSTNTIYRHAQRWSRLGVSPAGPTRFRDMGHPLRVQRRHRCRLRRNVAWPGTRAVYVRQVVAGVRRARGSCGSGFSGSLPGCGRGPSCCARERRAGRRGRRRDWPSSPARTARAPWQCRRCTSGP
jgi:hypothetical protein